MIFSSDIQTHIWCDPTVHTAGEQVENLRPIFHAIKVYLVENSMSPTPAHSYALFSAYVKGYLQKRWKADDASSLNIHE